MGVKIIRVTKKPLQQPMVNLIQGDSNTQVIRFLVKKDYGGHDLSGLIWSVWVQGFRGESEVSYAGVGTVSGDDIIIDWTVIPAVTKAPGITVLKLYGSSAGTTSNEYAWVSGNMQIAVIPTQMIDPMYDEDDIDEIRQLIEDFGEMEAELKGYTDTAVSAERLYVNGYITTNNAANVSMNNRINTLEAKKDLFEYNNLLDNWYFGRCINQRGSTTYTGSGFTIDRWIIDHDGSDNSLTLGNNCVTLERGNTGTYFHFGQNIPNDHGYTGKCVLSFLVDDYTKVSGIYYSENQFYTNIDDNLITFVINYIPTFVGISINANSTVKVYAAKLEIGENQSLAHKVDGVWVLNDIPDYTEQLRRCQRFFYKPDLVNFYMHKSSDLYNTYFGNLMLPVEMYSAPQVIHNNTSWCSASTRKDHILFYGTPTFGDSLPYARVNDIECIIPLYGG